METIKRFENFKNDNDIRLSEDQKKYLWSKIEYTKKKKAIANENDIFNILSADPSSGSITIDDFKNILDSLEYSVKKDMRNPDKKFRNPIAHSIHEIIPSDWIGVKFSRLKPKKED